MRSSVVSLLAAGVLALGAVPTTLALADEDRSGEPAGREDAGPPPWAPAHGHDKTKGKHAEKARDQAEKRRQQAEWPEDAQGPPPWAKAFGKRGAHGKGHAKAMRAWERCVAKAEPGAVCDKPTPPGLSR